MGCRFIGTILFALLIALSCGPRTKTIGVELPEPVKEATESTLEEMKTKFRKDPSAYSTFIVRNAVNDADHIYIDRAYEVRWALVPLEDWGHFTDSTYADLIDWSHVQFYRIPVFANSVHVATIVARQESGRWETSPNSISNLVEPWIFRVQDDYPSDEGYSVLLLDWVGFAYLMAVVRDGSTQSLAPIDEGSATILGIDPEVREFKTNMNYTREGELRYFCEPDSEYPFLPYQEAFGFLSKRVQKRIERRRELGYQQ